MFSLAFYKSADGMTWKKSSREKRLSEKLINCNIKCKEK